MRARARVGMLLGCGLVWALGQWDAAAIAQASDERDDQLGGYMDIGHAAVSRGIDRAADYLDHFFVDRRVDEEFEDSRLRVRVGGRVAEGGRNQVKANVTLNLALPYLERRVNFIIRSLGDDEDSELDPVGVRDGERDVVSGLRVFLVDWRGFKANVDGGLKFSPEPNPIVRLRGTYQWQAGEFLLRPTQLLYWRSDDGLGEISRLDVYRSLGAQYLARLRTEVEWAEDIRGVEVRPALSLYRVLGDRAGARFRFRFVVETEPKAGIDEYEASLRIRWSLFRRWLYFEVEPGLLLERDRDYEFSPEITARVELLFGPDYIGVSRD